MFHHGSSGGCRVIGVPYVVGRRAHEAAQRRHSALVHEPDHVKVALWKVARQDQTRYACTITAVFLPPSAAVRTALYCIVPVRRCVHSLQAGVGLVGIHHSSPSKVCVRARSITVLMIGASQARADFVVQLFVDRRGLGGVQRCDERIQYRPSFGVLLRHVRTASAATAVSLRLGQQLGRAGARDDRGRHLCGISVSVARAACWCQQRCRLRCRIFDIAHECTASHRSDSRGADGGGAAEDSSSSGSCAASL